MDEWAAEHGPHRATVAEPNFSNLFREMTLPALPAAVAGLVREITRRDPDMERVATVISAAPEITAKVLQTVNSSLFSLRNPVLSVRHAVALLGLRHIRPIALSHALVGAIPHPSGELFDHEGFWSDSLIRAMLARSFARRHCRGDEEEAFTAMLLADLAVPVLLLIPGAPYARTIQEWRTTSRRLSTLERTRFGWNHAQVGSWILQAWGLPRELTRFVGLHNASPAQIQESGLARTIAAPMVVAALAPSTLRSDHRRARLLVRAAIQLFGLHSEELVDLTAGVRESFRDICRTFDLRAGREQNVLDDLTVAASLEDGNRELPPDEAAPNGDGPVTLAA